LSFGEMILQPDGRRASGSVTRHGRSPDRERGKSQCRGIHSSEPDDRQVKNLACALGATRDAVPPRDEPAAFELRHERSDSVAVRGYRRSMGKAGTVPGLRSRSGDVSRRIADADLECFDTPAMRKANSWHRGLGREDEAASLRLCCRVHLNQSSTKGGGHGTKRTSVRFNPSGSNQTLAGSLFLSCPSCGRPSLLFGTTNRAQLPGNKTPWA
jgi:hypothetical protein